MITDIFQILIYCHLVISQEKINNIKSKMYELPSEMKARLVKELTSQTMMQMELHRILTSLTILRNCFHLK